MYFYTKKMIVKIQILRSNFESQQQRLKLKHLLRQLPSELHLKCGDTVG